MERRIVLAALTALCACAEVPPLRAVLDPLVEVRADGADLVVDARPIGDADGYVVRFTRGKGFPSSIVVGASELLAARPDETCPAETLVGTALFPITTVHGDVAQDGNATVMPDLNGPAIARTTMTYAVPYTSCDGVSQVLSGTSTFTFFPFGRIARHDDVTANQDPIANPNGCTSCPSPNYFFTSYWTFPSTVTPLRPDNTTVGEGDYPDPAACFDQGAVLRAAVRWTGTRNRILTTTLEDRARFVHDFVMQQPSFTANTQGAIDSYVQLDRVPFGMCFETIAGVSDAGVRVDGRAALMDSSGIYVDSGGYGKTVRIETSQATAPGFVVSLDGVYDHLRVKRAATDGQYYIPQRDGQRTLVWFRDPLMPGETAEIELLE